MPSEQPSFCQTHNCVNILYETGQDFYQFADWLASEFSGRPQMQATYDQAILLVKRGSPVLRLLGEGAGLCLQHGIPVSSPDAGPLMGPYFFAAVIIENCIRWGAQSSIYTKLDDATLTNCLHEAGNPGIAGSATLDAVDAAWYRLFQFAQGIACIRELINWPLGGPGDDLIRHFGEEFNRRHPLPPPPTPTPPPPPPPTTPPPPATSTHNIVINNPPGEVFTGTGLFSATVKGGPNPTAHVGWTIDGVHAAGPTPAGTQDSVTPLTITAQWSSLQTPNGDHLLGANWWTTLGVLIVNADPVHITVANGVSPPPPPPPPPPPGGVSCNISLSSGQVLSGTVPITATLQGGPYPNAGLQWLIDGSVKSFVAAPTTSATVPLTVTVPLDTTQLSNGNHTISINWVGSAGEVHCSSSVPVVIDNGLPPPPPPPIIIPQPQPGPTPDEFRNCCDELMNMLAQIANAIGAIVPALIRAFQPGGTTPPPTEPDYSSILRQLLNYLLSLATTLSGILGWLNQITATLAGEAVSLQNLSAMPQIVTTLTAIQQAILSLRETDPNYLRELECICQALQAIAKTIGSVDVSGIVHELSRSNADNQVPQSWIDALVGTESIPPELVQLYQGTTWPQILSAVAHFLGWVHRYGHEYTWGEVPRIFTHEIKPLLISIFNLYKEFTTDFNAANGPGIESLTAAASSVWKFIDSLVTSVVGFGVQTVIDQYEAGIGGIDTSNLGGVNEAQRTLLSRALEMGFGAHALATLPELVYFTKNLGLNQTAALVAEFAGFREVLINTHRPFLRTKLGRPAEYVYNRLYPTALPRVGDAATWHGRRIMDEAAAHGLYQSAGLGQTYWPFIDRASFRPVQPRALATLLQDQPTDRAALTRILEDNAYAPADVTFLLDAFDYASTKNVRNSYVGELVTAYAHGVMADDELTQSLQNLGWSNTAINLVVQRAALQRRVTLAAKVEAQIIPLVRNGLITPSAGSQQLEAAGVQPWYADLEMTLATTQAEIHAAVLAEKEAEREARQTQRNLTRSAIAEFRAGRINAAGLTAALAALGLTPSLITSIVTVEEAAQVGRMRHVFGQLLSPDDARLLQERVAAIEAQYKAGLINEAAAAGQLQTLGLDSSEINGLIARWATAVKKAGGGPSLVPVQTSG
jgi:hypothetical protein